MQTAFTSRRALGARQGRSCDRLPVACRPTRLVVVAAKKGDKKGGDKKGPKKSALAELLKKKEAAAAGAVDTTVAAGPGGVVRATATQYDTPEMRMLAFQICDSYWRATKKFLLEGVDFDQLGDALYRAPFVVVAHDRFQEGVTDPVYIYANHAALELWDATWEQLVGMPSRKSAEDNPTAQQERQSLLDQAADSRTNHISGFSGWRVGLSGRRFKIMDVDLVNIVDRAGAKQGQLATFSKYELEDGTVVQVQGLEASSSSSSGGEQEAAGAAPAALPIPSPEELEAAEVAVKEQADRIRAMKEVEGLKNADIQVQLAVHELKKRKDRLARMQKALEDALAASKAAFDDEDDD